MDTETLLIDEVERRGYGIDLNHLRGHYIISYPGAGNRWRDIRFNSMERALNWLRSQK